MSKSAVAQPPTDQLELDAAADEGGKAYVISEHRYGRVVVTLLGKDVKKPDGSTFTRKFFNVEKIYKDGDDKWQSTSYFEENELSLLPLAIADARRALHASK